MNGGGFVHVSADVVVAVRVAVVEELLFVRTGNHLECPVLLFRVVDGDPHGAAPQRVGDAEVGVVGVPVRPHAVARRLVEHLVEDLHHRVAEQRRHRFDHLGMERHGPEQATVRPKRNELKIALGLRDRHVTGQPGRHPAIHFPL